MTQPFFTMPNPAAHKLEALRQLFPQAVEVDDSGHIRVNAAVMQMALDPGNPAGVRVEEDGYELRWVGILIQKANCLGVSVVWQSY